MCPACVCRSCWEPGMQEPDSSPPLCSTALTVAKSKKSQTFQRVTTNKNQHNINTKICFLFVNDNITLTRCRHCLGRHRKCGTSWLAWCRTALTTVASVRQDNNCKRSKNHFQITLWLLAVSYQVSLKRIWKWKFKPELLHWDTF